MSGSKSDFAFPNPLNGRGTLKSPPDDTVTLTVVFVTRNEEEHIEDCIRTTMEAVEWAKRAGVIRSAEYILVDSASKDRTVKIASRFPIQVIQLNPSWPLSCGAGCYVGLVNARGAFTAIVNGDMTIDPEYFARAIPYLEPDVGGVCGVATENLGGESLVERVVRHFSTVPDLTGPLPPQVRNHSGGYSTGTFLLRTAAARSAGSFNPFFRAAEDTDLRHRLSKEGWKVRNIPVHQGLHYWSPRDEPLDVTQYYAAIWRNSVGLGQMARRNLPTDARIARRAAQYCLNVRGLAHGLRGLSLTTLIGVHLLAVLSAYAPWIVLAVLGDIAVLLIQLRGGRRTGLSPREWSFAYGVGAVVFSFFRATGFVRGFVAAPRGPEHYPSGARIVRD